MKRAFGAAVGWWCCVIAASFAAGAGWDSPSAGSGSGPVRCQILDSPYRSVYEVMLGYDTESDVGGYGKTSMIEADADWEFAYFENVLMADIDLNLDFGLLYITDDTAARLPDTLFHLALDSGWTWRYVNDMAAQFRLAPGLYGDLGGLSSDAIAMPFSGAWIYAFDRSASVMAGLAIRPGFEQVVVPLLGVEWEAAKPLRVRAAFPDSRVTFFPAPNWQTYVGLDWRSDTYAIDESEPDSRTEFTVEDLRAYVGVSHNITDQLQVIAQLGQFMSREFAFDSSEEDVQRHLDVDENAFLRVGVAGPF